MKSKGVQRLTLVLGSIAAVYFGSVVRQPIMNHGDASQALTYAFYNLVDIALRSGLAFFASWAAIRVIVWVVEGFLADRAQDPK